MMTPKEKAIELIENFFAINYIVKWDTLINEWVHDYSRSKQCALIAVDEILNVACDVSDYDISVTKTYWEEVKQEIEKL